AAIQKARDGKSLSVKFKGFSIKVLPASQLNVPEQLFFRTDSMLVGEPDFPIIRTPRAFPTLELTPSELTALDGCFRYFQWTRILGKVEPGLETTASTHRMKLGSAAHELLETGIIPRPTVLGAAWLDDLNAVFGSREWQELSASAPEREMPFMMHIDINGKECWIRGRMDAVAAGEIPRVIDYKYAGWREGADSDYEIQMMT